MVHGAVEAGLADLRVRDAVQPQEPEAPVTRETLGARYRIVDALLALEGEQGLAVGTVVPAVRGTLGLGVLGVVRLALGEDLGALGPVALAVVLPPLLGISPGHQKQVSHEQWV